MADGDDSGADGESPIPLDPVANPIGYAEWVKARRRDEKPGRVVTILYYVALGACGLGVIAAVYSMLHAFGVL